jgi:predicted aldo/keto reductase-like oxidoreductase
MPCPQGVSIMGMNLMKAWTKQLSKDALIAVWRETVEHARECADCRECVEKCPYDLPIPEMLRENIALYESVALL